MQTPLILIVLVVVLCERFCGISSQYCKRPDPSEAKRVSERISECQRAVADLDSCPVPDSVVGRKSRLIKSALQRELQRLKHVDPAMPLQAQVAQIEAHHALLAAYESLRRRRQLMGDAVPRPSKHNVHRDSDRDRGTRNAFVQQGSVEGDDEYYEDDDYYPAVDRVDERPSKGWPMMKDL